MERRQDQVIDRWPRSANHQHGEVIDMRMFNDEDILSQAFRSKVIEQIKGQPNQKRKLEAMKRQDCYRDNTIKWVMKSLKELNLREETLNLMQNHASNISIVKKVIGKKARCYRGGVLRGTPDDDSTNKVMALASVLNSNEYFKKADRQSELHNNSLILTLPSKTPENRVRLNSTVLGPWQYDVIEDARNPEKMACLIISEWNEKSSAHSFNSDQIQALDQSTSSDDQIIARGPFNADTDDGETFIWWTNTYHFTTNSAGQIIAKYSPQDSLNPIKMIPATSIDKNQDGSYWGAGGEDLVDGAVLVNLLCSDMNHIMYMQGWGQLVISGSNIPETYQVGPGVALILKVNEGMTAPTVELLSHSPPIDSWLKVIEQYVAMLLTTNELSTSSVAMSLDASTFPSGIAMLIDKSESTGSIEDKRHTFAQAERRYWKIVAGWLNIYARSLTPLDNEFAEIGPLNEDIEVNVRYQSEEQVVTEKEKLEILKMRKEMGLATQLDIIKADNPSMTDDEAQKKLEQIKEDMKLAVVQASDVADKMTPSKDESNSQPE